MTYAIQKQKKDTSIRDKSILTQALNRVGLQQSEGTEPAGRLYVPVSIGSGSCSSSSITCSLSSKEGSENGDIISSKPLPSVITTRPAKKARRISYEPARPANFVANASSSVLQKRSVSPQLPQHQSSVILLGQEEDEMHVSPLHVFIRRQIEVFSATATELAQPAPGRKQPIQLHQVGLRCIHCRNAKVKVKRAVCYPSSVGRIYHSVSDMKFDHFNHCKEVPSEVRKTFEALKAEGKSSSKEKRCRGSGNLSSKGISSSSTAKYYRNAALRIGLVDRPGGTIYMNIAPTTQHPTNNNNMVSPMIIEQNGLRQALQAPSTARNFLELYQYESYRKFLFQQQNLTATASALSSIPSSSQMSRIVPGNNNKENVNLNVNHHTTVINSGVLQSLLLSAMKVGANAQKSIDAAAIALANQQPKSDNQCLEQNTLKRPHPSSSRHTNVTHTAFKPPVGKTIVSLVAPNDAKALNPIHCFVRKHVELFSADENDLAAPCPGRKTRVKLGQVGIRCRHCAKLNLLPKERVKRAVCYPPSIEGIYHSVSNMKFDHFGICPHLPFEAKEELAYLRASSSGRNNSGTNTAQYYRESAVAKGLVDTDEGIRFCSPCIAPVARIERSLQPIATTPVPARSPQFLTGMSALMMAASSQATSS